MSSSRHPVALRLERFVGGDVRLLATVMALPLVDGIFPALVLAGALDGPTGVLEVGLLIFGGSATLAVVLAEMDAPPRRAARSVLVVGGVLVAGAAVEAALAPTIESLVRIPTFERFAALVVAAIAAKTASASVGEYLPGPGVVVGLGFLASVDPAGARFVVDADPALVGRAVAAAGVGTAFALGAALLGPRLRAVVDLDRFRFGSAVALGLLPLSILGLQLGHAPLLVVGVAGLLAYDPDDGGAARDAGEDEVSDPETTASIGGPDPPGSDPATVADGGDAGRSRRSGGDRSLAPGGNGSPGSGGDGSSPPDSDGDPGSDGDDDREPGSDGGEPGSDGDDGSPGPDAGGGSDGGSDRDPEGAAVRETDGERAPWL